MISWFQALAAFEWCQLCHRYPSVSTAQTDAGPQDALFAAVTILAGAVTIGRDPVQVESS